MKFNDFEIIPTCFLDGHTEKCYDVWEDGN